MPMNPEDPDFLDLEQTINLCDFALYIAKENGRNRAVHIELHNQGKPDNVEKEYLTNLNKSVKLNKDYIDIQYIV